MSSNSIHLVVKFIVTAIGYDQHYFNKKQIFKALYYYPQVTLPCQSSFRISSQSQRQTQAYHYASLAKLRRHHDSAIAWFHCLLSKHSSIFSTAHTSWDNFSEWFFYQFTPSSAIYQPQARRERMLSCSTCINRYKGSSTLSNIQFFICSQCDHTLSYSLVRTRHYPYCLVVSLCRQRKYYFCFD